MFKSVFKQSSRKLTCTIVCFMFDEVVELPCLLINIVMTLNWICHYLGAMSGKNEVAIRIFCIKNQVFELLISI